MSARPTPRLPGGVASLALLILAAGVGCGDMYPAAHLPGHAPPAKRQASVSSGTEYVVPPPPFSEGVFPCSDCHADLEANATPRKLEEEHTAIKLEHGPRERWCFDCHNPPDRDKLRLASGTLVPFTESYRLCGQCHGDKYRDWRVGVHGKRTGQWNGERRYLLCAHCHNPHSPRFKPLKPEPPPHRPGRAPTTRSHS
ncbi:MAG: hypothetical protein IT371_04935 [Deltaproteobacteria bacterium]|nr:hypothetical protein [Deltaproteobacteria bacterium]